MLRSCTNQKLAAIQERVPHTDRKRQSREDFLFAIIGVILECIHVQNFICSAWLRLGTVQKYTVFTPKGPYILKLLILFLFSSYIITSYLSFLSQHFYTVFHISRLCHLCLVLIKVNVLRYTYNLCFIQYDCMYSICTLIFRKVHSAKNVRSMYVIQ
jgi:hypothetical protein